MISQNVQTAVWAMESSIREWRRWLHAHPEVAHQEEQTAHYLRELLEGWRYVVTQPTTTSIVTQCGDAPRIALRADMDALPLLEDSGVPFASLNRGCMHACGHDAHMAMLLGAAWYFAQHPQEAGDGVRFIFQPAEELPPGGAPLLIDAGVMEGIDRVFSLHLLVTAPTGTLQLRSGAVLANADGFDITIKGRGGHGAEPLGTADAVLIACEVVNALHHVVSRMTSPFDPVALTIGQISAGTARNIIADHAQIAGTLRTLSRDTQERLAARLTAISEHIARAYGAEAHCAFEQGYPVLVNNADVVDALTGAMDTPGLLQVGPGEEIKLAGDDFSYYLVCAPGAYGFLGCRPPGNVVADHHSPEFIMDEAALPLGTMAYISAVQTFVATGP